MEDLAQLLTALGNLAPWVAALALVVIVIFRWFSYREKRLEASDNRALARSLDGLGDKVEVAVKQAASAAEKTDTVLQALTTHNTSADERAQQHLVVFKDILKQLVTLNASSGSHLSPDNSKTLIHYQWSWCRDETARLIADSVLRNHFRGNELTVAGNVYRAWVKTAQASLDSVERFDGLMYPYAQLYTHHIDMIWKLVWADAIELYHTPRPSNPDDFRVHTTTFERRVSSLFDIVFQLHVEIVEDIETGLLYSENGDSLADTVIPQDPSVPEVMAKRLRDFNPRTDESSVRRAQWSRDAIKKRMVDQRSRWKTKSSVSVPAVKDGV